MKRAGYIYILTNKYKSVLYVGVTSKLPQRIQEHKRKKYRKSFTARYNVDRLVYYESYISIKEAILREKQIKSGGRLRKIALIESMNPDWKDLYDDFVEDHL